MVAMARPSIEGVAEIGNIATFALQKEPLERAR